MVPQVAPRQVMAIVGFSCVNLSKKPIGPLAPKTGKPAGSNKSFEIVGCCFGEQISPNGMVGHRLIQ